MPKIVVLVTFTPDLTADRSFLADGTVDRVSVPGRLSEARYPSLKGIMAAKKKPVDTWGPADLGIDPGLVGLAGARGTVLSAPGVPPGRPAGCPAWPAGQLVKDDGDGGRALAGFLTAHRFI